MDSTTRPRPLDDLDDCPDCRANETHLLDLVDSLSTLVGWQVQRIARLEDTVRALGDEADRLVTARDEEKVKVGRLAGRLVQARRAELDLADAATGLVADLRRMDAEQAIELDEWPAARDLIVAVERAQ